MKKHSLKLFVLLLSLLTSIASAHYDPSIGRWLNRDPIAENGGVNLYGFVGNDGVGKLDLFGLSLLSPTANAFNLNSKDVAELKELFKQLNEKTDSQCRRCYEAVFDAEDKTINGMFDDVKKYDITFLVAHGDTDENNYPRVYASDGPCWSISIADVSHSEGNQVYFYACNQDENGKRLVDPQTKKPYPASDQSLTKSQKGVAGWLAEKLKALLEVKDCPTVKTVGTSAGPR